MKNDVYELIDHFQQILVERENRNFAKAYARFKQIKVSDFPVMPDFPMSHGILSDPKGALFFVDHDWSDDEWCNLFLRDVIRALKKAQVTSRSIMYRYSNYC